MLLAGLFLLACSAWFLIQMGHSTQGGTLFHELGPLTSSINEENIPEMCPQVNLMDEFSQLRIPLPRYV